MTSELEASADGAATAVRAGFNWRFMTPLLLGSFLNPINSSMIATALSPIATSFHVSVGRTAILVSVLYLACAIAQPTAGKLSEEFGPRRVFLTGIVVVLLGGVLGGAAPDLPALVVARILIGIGTSAGYPSAMLLVRRRAEQMGLEQTPGSVLGGITIAGVGTIAVGLPLGGVLVDAWGWRSTFYFNVPVCVVAFICAAWWIAPDPPVGRLTVRAVVTRTDLVGILAFAGLIASLLTFMTSLPSTPWGWLGASVVFAVAMVRWERRASDPFVDVRLLVTNLALTRIYIRYALITVCVYTVLYGLTQWLQDSRGESAREAGLLLVPMSLVSVAAVALVSRRNLVRMPMLVSSAASVVGSIGIAFLAATSPIGWALVISGVFGVTLGLSLIGNTTALYMHSAAAKIGTASGLLRTAGYLGSIASSSIIAVTFRHTVTDGGLHRLAVIMIGASLLALVLGLVDPALRRRSDL